MNPNLFFNLRSSHQNEDLFFSPRSKREGRSSFFSLRSRHENRAWGSAFAPPQATTRQFNSAREAGDSAISINESFDQRSDTRFLCRPLRGRRVIASDLGLRCRSTPGFIPAPAPQAEKRIASNCLIGALLILLCPLFIAAQNKRGFQPADLYALKDVSDAQISPDGERVVYTVSEVSPDRSRSISRLWIVPTAGGESKRLTSDEASESTARWSPDGKLIAFYSDRDKQHGLWITSADGSAPQLVAHIARTNFFLTKAGESFTWSPDSRRIAFLSSPENLNITAKVATSGATNSSLAGIPERMRRPLTVEEINQLPPEIRDLILRAQGRAAGNATVAVPAAPPVEADKPAPSARPDDPRVITRLQYKSRTSFSDNLQSHIFIADLTMRQITQLTDGQYYEHSINWSPKGDEIVFVSNHEPDPDKVNNTDLFVVNVQSGAVRQLTKTKGCEWQPVFSPDGSQIAYLATKREVTTIDSVAEDTQAYVISISNLEVIANLVNDKRVSSVKWIEDKHVSLTFVSAGKMELANAELFHGKDIATGYWFLRASRGEGSVSGFSLGKSSQQIALTYTAPATPNEVFVLKKDASNDIASLHRENLSRANSELFFGLQLSTMREFKFSNDGFEVQGWLYPPINLDEKKKYPVILNIHGGPHGMHGYSFNPTAQALAARGYGVLLINPRGSSGYGQKFADGCVNDWGGGDYRDLMRGVDEALAKFPFLDKDRMGVMGGSYGGYMTNWIVTQTDRFRAAVASASLSNLISFYSTSLYQDLIHAEFGGMPWDNYDLLWDRSPLKHIKKARTPLLLIHGEQDNDVHITQAEEMYTALRMRGVETVFVRYPREGHGLREPAHHVDSLNRTLEWFDRHLKQTPPR
jgi:dipeptidyl aminopeptidase/acylaminoacyl peptidase